MVHAIFSRFGLMLVLLVIQVVILLGVFQWFEEFLPHFFGGTVLVSFVMVVGLLNSKINPTAKITWLIVLLLVPVFGVLLFLYTQGNFGHRVLKTRVNEMITDTRNMIPQDGNVLERFCAENQGAAALARYVHRSGCYPVFDKTAVTYFPLGEDKFEEMLKQLEAAEHFIFMEYILSWTKGSCGGACWKYWPGKPPGEWTSGSCMMAPASLPYCPMITRNG